MSEDGAPLRLVAVDAEDLAVVSSALQDAIVPIGDMAFHADKGQFVLAANRYRWEGDTNAGERVNAGVTFSNVVSVRRRGVDFRGRERFLNLLSITCTSGEDAAHPVVEITFAGDNAIRLETTGLLCHLEDFGEPWPTQWRPQHADD